MQETHNPKVNVFNHPDIKASLEYTKELVCIHIEDYSKLKPSTYKEIVKWLKDLNDFLTFVGYQGLYAAIKRDNYKTKKFAMLTGFVYLGTKQGCDIYIYKGKD